MFDGLQLTIASFNHAIIYKINWILLSFFPLLDPKQYDNVINI